MGKAVQYLFAQIETKAGGVFVYPAIVSGITFFENSGEILFGNAYACIGNGKYLPVIHPDGHAALAGIFNGVGQDLLNDKREPLFIGKHLLVSGFIIQGEFFSGQTGRRICGLPDV